MIYVTPWFEYCHLKGFTLHLLLDVIEKTHNMETITATKATEMNAILKAIYERRAVRKYKNKAVPKDLIEKLLDAARMAPSAMNKQPWRFYVVTGKSMLKIFSEQIAKAAAGHFHLAFASGVLNHNDLIFHNAPVVIFITAPKDSEWARLDVGMCAQNIMLAAKSLGLDTCPVGFGKYIQETDAYKMLKVPDKEQVLLSVIAGYGDENPEPHERNKKNAFFFE